LTVNRQKAEEHFRKDVWYPITAEGIKEVFDNMAHFTTEERNWMIEHVPPGIYANPEDAISAVQWGSALNPGGVALKARDLLAGT
jgi:hypothetical protein